MLSLLRLQLFRIIKDASLRLFLLISIGLAFFTTLTPFLLALITEEYTSMTYVPDLILTSFTFLGSVVILFVIAYTIFFNKEIRYGTFRNYIVSGYSRLQIFISFVITGIILGVSFILLNQLFTLGFGSLFGSFINFKTFPQIFDGALFLKKYFLNLLLFVTFLTFLVSINLAFQKMGLSLVISIAIPTLLSTVFLILPLTLAINFKDQPETWNSIQGFLELITFYQSNSFSNFSSFGSMFDATSLFEVTDSMVIKTIITSLVEIGIFLTGGFLIFNHRDIK